MTVRIIEAAANHNRARQPGIRSSVDAQPGSDMDIDEGRMVALAAVASVVAIAALLTHRRLNRARIP